ncbi:MAG: cytochrome P450 [Isosphaerales bacterium]
MIDNPRATDRYDLLSPEFLADPYPLYARLRADDPVHWSKTQGYWFVSRYEDVHATARDPRFSSNSLDTFMNRLPAETHTEFAPLRALLADRMLLTDPPRHNRLRGLVHKAFTPRRVELLRTTVQTVLDELLERVQQGGSFDVIHDVADPLPSRMITMMLGIPAEDRDRFKSWTDAIYLFMGLSGVSILDRARVATSAVGELTDYLPREIAVVRRSPRDDLFSDLVAAEEQGDTLTEAEMISNVVGILNAGHETTTNLIGNGVLTLLQNSGSWELLRDDPALIPLAVEEILRYESPIQMISRLTAENVEVRGVTIGQGQPVALILGSANRDPEQFPDADRFDIRRPDNRHVAFGHGPHFCIGGALARVVGQVVFGTLPLRFPGLRLATDRHEWRPYPLFRGLRRLPVVF